MNTYVKRHYFNVDTDRCVCGGEIVYFEDGDKNDQVGEGCEIALERFIWKRGDIKIHNQEGERR